MRRLPVVAVLLVLLLSLSGCGAPGAPGARVTPEAGHPATTLTGPATVISTPCAALAPPAEVSAVFGHSVSPADATPQSWAGIPQLALHQAGGISCGWTDGSGHSLTIEALPHADAAWSGLSHLMSNTDGDGAIVTTNPVIGDASFVECVSDAVAAVPACSFDIRASGYWLHLDVVGVTESPASDAIARSATSAIVSQGAAAAAWQAPHGTRVAPASCAGLVPLDQARAAASSGALTEQFDVSATLYPQQVGAILAAGGIHCSWLQDPDAGDGTDGSAAQNEPPNTASLTVTILDGGSWAWDGTTAPPNTDSTLEFSRVTLAAGTGWGACSPTEYLCVVDL
ncbi:MAG: hypothetical protein V4479_09505, partial [Actinomycetota bacterium]